MRLDLSSQLCRTRSDRLGYEETGQNKEPEQVLSVLQGKRMKCSVRKNTSYVIKRGIQGKQRFTAHRMIPRQGPAHWVPASVHEPML